MYRLMLPALASLALLAGCGSSSKSTSAPASTPTQTTSPSGGAAASGGASPASTSSSTTPPKNFAQAAARCKASVDAAPTLNAAAKSKLDSLCDQAAKGNTADLRKTAAEVCQQLIKSSVPAAEQQAALANCPKP